ncbi:MAG: hypothetical protein P8X79_17210 [Reinekea sp.]
MKIHHASSHQSKITPVISSCPESPERSNTQETVREPRILSLTVPTSMSDDEPASRRVLAADVSEIAKSMQNHLHEKCRDADSQFNHGRYFPGSKNSRLEAYVSASQKLTDHVTALLEKYRIDPGTDRIDPKTILSIEDAAKISRAFEAIAKRLPKGEMRELAGLLGLHLKAAWSQMKVEEVRASLLDKLAPYQNPETSMSDTVSAAISLDAGMPGIKIGKFKIKPLAVSIRQVLGLGKGSELSVNPEGIVYVYDHTIRKGQTSAEVGIDVPVISDAKFSGKIQTARFDTKLKRYATVEDLVEKCGHTQRWSYANRDEYSGILKTSTWSNIGKRITHAIRHKRLPSSSELADLKVDQQHATDNQKRLDELLKNVLGLEHAKVSAPPPDRTPEWTGRSTYITASVGGSVKANLKGIAGGDVDLTYKRMALDFLLFDKMTFTKAVLSDPKYLNDLPAKLMKHASDSLAHTDESTPERQQAATEKLQDMKDDLQRYFTVVKDLDGVRFRERAGLVQKQTTKNNLRNEKHRLENKWHAIGRHNLLQVMSASHALLTFNALPKGGYPTDEANKLVSDTAELLAKPDINYDKHRLADAAHIKIYDVHQDHSNTIKASARVSVMGQSGEVSISQEKLSRLNVSRMRQGEYINNEVSLTGTIDPSGAAYTASELAAQLGRKVNIPEGFASVFDDGMTSVTGSRTRTHLERQYSPEYVTYPEYEGDKDFKTRFTRNTLSDAKRVSIVGEGPVAPGINMGGEVEYVSAKTHMLNQTLGTDNLSYVLLILKRELTNKAAHPQGRNQFYENHKTEFSEIFKKLGDPESNVSKEARFFLNELIDGALDSELDRARHSLNTIYNGNSRMSDQTQAMNAMNVLIRPDASAKEKNSAIDALNGAIHSIPWKRLKEPVPLSSAISTLGIGRGHYKIKAPTSKLEKAEEALAQLSGSGINIKDRKVKDAIATLTRLFKTLNAESDYDQSRKTLKLLIEKLPETSTERRQAETALNKILNSNEPRLQDSSNFNTDRQNGKRILSQLIEQHADTQSGKVEMQDFAEQFRQTMAEYREDPFFEFHQYQSKPTAASEDSVLEDRGYSQWQADSAFKTGTRFLLNAGLHPRVLRQSKSVSPAHNRSVPNSPRNTPVPESKTPEASPQNESRPVRTTMRDILKEPQRPTLAELLSKPQRPTLAELLSEPQSPTTPVPEASDASTQNEIQPVRTATGDALKPQRRTLAELLNEPQSPTAPVPEASDASTQNEIQPVRTATGDASKKPQRRTLAELLNEPQSPTAPVPETSEASSQNEIQPVRTATEDRLKKPQRRTLAELLSEPQSPTAPVPETSGASTQNEIQPVRTTTPDIVKEPQRRTLAEFLNEPQSPTMPVPETSDGSTQNESRRGRSILQKLFRPKRRNAYADTQSAWQSR